VPTPIFADESSSVIPGELIVQLHEDAVARVTASIPRGPTRGLVHAGPRAFGIESLDKVLAALKVTSIVSLHPPFHRAAMATETAVAMASTFRIRFQESTDVEQAAVRINKLAEVEFAEPNRYRETCIVPNDPSFPTQWGLNRIHCQDAWDRTIGSPNIIVGVIDTGVDLDHPELAPLLVAGTDMVDLGPNPTAPAGFHFEGDFVGRDNDPQDEVGHGTHVAGTIACLSNNGTGVAGVTWNCRVMPVRVLARIVNNANPSDVRGVGSAADIAAGIRWAVDHGARVLNLSLGGTTDTQVERDAIAYAIAQGAVVVAAMGNGFQQGNPTSYPAAYPDVVAVGAINQANQRAVFSQTGAHIDVAGPGAGILSTVWDNGFATMSGTSMATPHVAGVAALILSCNANLTGPQVADILRQTAEPLKTNPADPVPNNEFGFGCVDARAAVNRACPQRPSVPILRCPSVAALCPSLTVRCPSRPIVTCPSVATLCPSRPLIRCPSVATICPSQHPLTCPRPSLTVRCPSLTTVCPTQRPLCSQPSLAVRCPSGLVCGGFPPPEHGGDPFGGTPGQDPYGCGQEWEQYDPYAMYYGDEEDEQ